MKVAKLYVFTLFNVLFSIEIAQMPRVTRLETLQKRESPQKRRLLKTDFALLPSCEGDEQQSGRDNKTMLEAFVRVKRGGNNCQLKAVFLPLVLKSSPVASIGRKFRIATSIFLARRNLETVEI